MKFLEKDCVLNEKKIAKRIFFTNFSSNLFFFKFSKSEEKENKAQYEKKTG